MQRQLLRLDLIEAGVNKTAIFRLTFALQKINY